MYSQWLSFSTYFLFNFFLRERIELFIDENKALMKRMYGEFETGGDYGPPGQEVYEEDARTERGRRQVPRPGNHTSDTGRYLNWTDW